MTKWLIWSNDDELNIEIFIFHPILKKGSVNKLYNAYQSAQQSCPIASLCIIFASVDTFWVKIIFKLLSVVCAQEEEKEEEEEEE